MKGEAFRLAGWVLAVWVLVLVLLSFLCVGVSSPGPGLGWRCLVFCVLLFGRRPKYRSFPTVSGIPILSSSTTSNFFVYLIAEGKMVYEQPTAVQDGSLDVTGSTSSRAEASSEVHHVSMFSNTHTLPISFVPLG